MTYELWDTLRARCTKIDEGGGGGEEEEQQQQQQMRPTKQQMKASVTPQARQSQTPSTTAEQTQLPLLQLHFFKPSLSMWLIKLKTSKNNAICVCLKTPWFILIFPTKLEREGWKIER